MDGLPNLRILKHWTLIGFHCYLFFSLNFVGVFANEYPPRISSYSRVSDVVDKQEVSLFSLFVYFFFRVSLRPIAIFEPVRKKGKYHKITRL